MFAHADELAFGSLAESLLENKSDPSPTSDPASHYGGAGTAGDLDRLSRGNRPSSLLLCNKLDAFSCGQLIALAEHRVAVKAHICGHTFWHNELGSSLRMPRTHQLEEGLITILNALDGPDDDEIAEIGNTNLSTRTILRHYGKLVKETRGSR